jgi:hypothetical protein
MMAVEETTTTGNEKQTPLSASAEGGELVAPRPSEPIYKEQPLPELEERIVAQRERQLADAGLTEVGVVRGRSWAMADPSQYDDQYLNYLEKRANAGSSEEYPVTLVRGQTPQQLQKDVIMSGRPMNPGEVTTHDPMGAEQRAAAEKEATENPIKMANTLPEPGKPVLHDPTKSGADVATPVATASVATTKPAAATTPSVVKEKAAE